MPGIVIAIIVAAWVTLIGNNTMEAGYLSGVGFLWAWYWIWTIFISIIVVIMMLWEETQSNLGGLLGFAAGGALSILVIAGLAIRRALLLIGTYLLMTAGTVWMTFAEFSTSKLIFGTLFLLTGLVMSRRAGSSSSN